MRFTITMGGSRGDVQPYVALGLGLKEAGHEVIIATAPEFEEFVTSRGLEFYPVAVDVQSVLGELLESRPGSLGLARGLAEQYGPILAQNARDFREASQGSRAILYGPSGFMGYFVARAEGLASAAAEMQPVMRPTAEYRSSVLPALPGFLQGRPERAANRLGYVAVHEMFWQSFRESINAAVTEELGLPPIQHLTPFRNSFESEELALCGWSPRVLPVPRDYGRHMRVTGYWFLDAGEWFEPPSSLADFLDSGPLPISIGFGSMNRIEPERVAEVIRGVVSRTGQRMVFLTGWSGILDSDLPDEVYCVDQIPHDWLFPRVSAAVHHGGAGSTAASLRAGIPTVTAPVFFDQGFWGERVAQLGAGPELVPFKKLSIGRLQNAITEATQDPHIRESARILGEGIRREDGVRAAVGWLEEHEVVGGKRTDKGGV